MDKKNRLRLVLTPRGVTDVSPFIRLVSNGTEERAVIMMPVPADGWALTAAEAKQASDYLLILSGLIEDRCDCDQCANLRGLATLGDGRLATLVSINGSEPMVVSDTGEN